MQTTLLPHPFGIFQQFQVKLVPIYQPTTAAGFLVCRAVSVTTLVFSMPMDIMVAGGPLQRPIRISPGYGY